MAKVIIPSGYARRSTIEILAKWNNVDVEIAEDASVEIPSLTIGEQTVSGIPAIAGLLGRTSKNSKTWAKETLGDTQPVKSSLISQFIDIAETAASGTAGVPLMTTIGQVSLHLKTRRFLAAENLTAADVIMYCTLHKEVSEKSDAEKMNLCDVCRWISHVHSILNDPFPELKLKKIPFNHSATGAAKKEKKEGEQQPKKEGEQQPKKEGEQQPKKEGEQKPKKEKKEKKEKKPAPQQPKKEEPEYDPASYIDVRIGKIVQIEPHPGADTLYHEEIDIGGGVIKHVITGVRNFVPIEQMQGRHVVVFCNIKPSKIRGLPSEGMVFAGSNPEHTVVELLDPPADTPIGTRVLFGDFCKTEPVPVDKKGKLWEAVCPHCKIDENGFATYKGQPLTVPQGKICVPTLRSTEFH
jgi:methionine--tRNA ligase beta chain